MSHWQISRRDLMRAGAALPAAGAASRAAAAAGQRPLLDLAEWSYEFVGAKTVLTARGDVMDGRALYREIYIPRDLRREVAVVLVHGGAGQGTDWMSTPDGRWGWLNYLLGEGYAVHVVDRQGQGRAPYHPAIHGDFAPEPPLYEDAVRRAAAPGPQHTRWPGTGRIGDAALDQFMAAQGQAVRDPVLAEGVWREHGAALMDRVGPAVMITHGDSSRFAWVVADARPALVRGIVVLEPDGPPFRQAETVQGPAAPIVVVQPLPWGLTRTPVAYDPPADDPAALQSGAPRRLAKLSAIPMAVVTAQASAAAGRDPGIVDFLRRSGCMAEQIRLADAGVTGNGPFVMMETNNREALAPILQWIERRVAPPKAAPSLAPPRPNGDSTAVRLADLGGFFVGVQRRAMPYGTIATGQSFVQYAVPAEVRHRTAVVMIHGGIGQGLHMLGIGGRPGWAHYFLREGYRVYLVDRPQFGRSPSDTIFDSRDRPQVAAGIGAQMRPGPMNPPSGLHGEDLALQFAALEHQNPASMAAHSELFVRGGLELLDRIGPSIVLTHAWSGSQGWLLADRRPGLVKAMVTLESNNAPFEGEVAWGLTAIPVAYDPPAASPADLRLAEWTPPAGSLGDIRPFRIQAEPARRLKNLAGIPTLWVINNPSRYSGPAQVRFLQQAGVDVELMDLGKYGVGGFSNLVNLQKKNFEAFVPIRDWLATKEA